MIRSPGLARGGTGYAVSYGVNDGQPVPLATNASASEAGIVIAADVARLLASLPDHGQMTVSVTAREGVAMQGRYSLAGLMNLRNRLAPACKWPTPAGAPGK